MFKLFHHAGLKQSRTDLSSSLNLKGSVVQKQNNLRKVLANVFFISFFAFVASKSIAQPFVLECDLDTKYVRDNVVEKDLSGVWCKSCKVTIAVHERGYLSIRGVNSEFAVLYDTKGKRDVDSLGWGFDGTWSISSTAIEGSYTSIKRNKNAGWTSVTINRLTGDFFGYLKTDNPIGEGDIVVTTKGQCRAIKAAF